MRLSTMLQSVLAAERLAARLTAQFTGLYLATSCIHRGMSACAMNTDERKVSGSSTKLLTAIMVSSRRESRAMALESAPMAVPSSTAHDGERGEPGEPPGYVGADDQAEHDDDDRLDHADDGALDEPPGDERARGSPATPGSGRSRPGRCPR